MGIKLKVLDYINYWKTKKKKLDPLGFSFYLFGTLFLYEYRNTFFE